MKKLFIISISILSMAHLSYAGWVLGKDSLEKDSTTCSVIAEDSEICENAGVLNISKNKQTKMIDINHCENIQSTQERV